MSINLMRPSFTSFSTSYNTYKNHTRSTCLVLLYKSCSFTSFPVIDCLSLKASSSQHNNNHVSVDEEKTGVVLDEEVISRAATLNDATQVVQIISESGGSSRVCSSDCCRIIKAAFKCNNTDLALSIFAAMRSSAFDHGVKENAGFVERWKWPRPDLITYTTLVIGLAASLRVSDALKIVDDMCRVGLSSVDEVPFGKIVRCPTCLIAVAVAQPQQDSFLCKMPLPV